MPFSEQVLQRIVWLIATDEAEAARAYAGFNLPAGGHLESLRAALEGELSDEFQRMIFHKAPWLLETSIRRPGAKAPSIEEMIERIRRTYDFSDPKTITEMRKGVGAVAHPAAGVFSEAIKRLVEGGLLFTSNEKTGGRALTRYSFNADPTPKTRGQDDPFAFSSADCVPHMRQYGGD